MRTAISIGGFARGSAYELVIQEMTTSPDVYDAGTQKFTKEDEAEVKGKLMQALQSFRFLRRERVCRWDNERDGKVCVDGVGSRRRKIRAKWWRGWMGIRGSLGILLVESGGSRRRGNISRARIHRREMCWRRWRRDRARMWMRR